VSALVLVPERHFADAVLVSVTAFLAATERNGAPIIGLRSHARPAVDPNVRRFDVRL